MLSHSTAVHPTTIGSIQSAGKCSARRHRNAISKVIDKMKWRHLVLLSLLSVGGFLCSGASAQDPVPWIRQNAIPISTAKAGHGFNDLQPLKPVIHNARVVELGEATHGRREFFQLSHRTWQSPPCGDGTS
jgi:hypothetical protein